jgi:hypothetical protein
MKPVGFSDRCPTPCSRSSPAASAKTHYQKEHRPTITAALMDWPKLWYVSRKAGGKMDDSFLNWCRDQRDYMVHLREEYASGKRCIGEMRNGVQVDQTKEEIIELGRRIASLDQLLEDDGKRNAPRS